MTRHALPWLAWGIAVLCIATEAAALALLIVAAPADLAGQLAFVPAVVGFAMVGALIATRRPENVIGWLFCVASLVTVIGLFGEQYVLYGATTRAGALPASLLVGWLGNWMGTAGWLAIWTFTLLLFPTGRPPSPRWRPFAWVVAAILGLVVVTQAVKPGPMFDRDPAIPNPFGVADAAGLAAALDATPWGFVLIVGVCATSVLVRFRTARGVEHQQLKWFVSAAGLAIVAVALDYIVSTAAPGSLPDLVGDMALGLAMAAVPAAAGVAILRHRLYEIDLIVNRTLVYALLTGALIAVYFGCVVVLQQAFRLLTGQESDLAIVAATLVIAGLFNPLRGRIQSGIDRRFYRRHYDAPRILAAHSAAVRDEVDIDRLTQALVRAADETLKPTRASVWLRTPEDGR